MSGASVDFVAVRGWDADREFGSDWFASGLLRQVDGSAEFSEFVPGIESCFWTGPDGVGW